MLKQTATREQLELLQRKLDAQARGFENSTGRVAG